MERGNVTKPAIVRRAVYQTLNYHFLSKGALTAVAHCQY